FRLINGETVWVDGPVTVAAESGAVLCLDEIDMGGHLMMCLQPVLEGKPFYLKKVRRWVTPAAGFTVVATANTKGKGSEDNRFAGDQVMNEAMLDRFAITMEQDYPTVATEKKILTKVFKSLGVDATDFAEHLVKRADITRKAFKEGAVSELISTRRL
ncbi:MAG: AAA family ATPase, partial [Candidatus Nanopelagicaceae bacterium]